MIIGLCGKIKSGKTTVAEYLSKKYNLPIYNFATPLKKLVTEMSDLTDEHKDSTLPYDGRNINTKPLRKELFKFKYDQLTVSEIDHIKALEYCSEGEIYRHLLQRVGTNIFRTRNNLHWVQMFNMEHRSELETGFIVGDIRFRNEHNLISNYDNANIYKVIRKNNIESDHKSETEMDKIVFNDGFIIFNDTANLKDLYTKVDSIVKIGE